MSDIDSSMEDTLNEIHDREVDEILDEPEEIVEESTDDVVKRKNN